MILLKTKLTTPYLFILLVIIVNIQTQAQNKQRVNSNFKNELHWDLSIDAYNLLKSGTPMMMLRYAKNPEKSALRLNLGFDYNNTKPLGKVDSLSPTVHIYTQSTLNYMLEGGMEFRKSNGRFHLFYGPSVNFSWYKQKIVPSDQLATTFETSTVTVSKLGAGFFVGVRYFVLKNLALSSEASFDYYKQKSKLFIAEDKDQAAVTPAYGFRFLPLSHLHISFFF